MQFYQVNLTLLCSASNLELDYSSEMVQQHCRAKPGLVFLTEGNLGRCCSSRK